jgi:hypothetical protein
MNTFLKYLQQTTLLQAELEKAQAELAKAELAERALMARASQQALVISALVGSHPQIEEIDRIYAKAMTTQKRRRSQIQMLKLEVEHTRKSFVGDPQPCTQVLTRKLPERSPVVWC